MLVLSLWVVMATIYLIRTCVCVNSAVQSLADRQNRVSFVREGGVGLGIDTCSVAILTKLDEIQIDHMVSTRLLLAVLIAIVATLTALMGLRHISAQRETA
jgi:hypothetical protein